MRSVFLLATLLQTLYATASLAEPAKVVTAMSTLLKSGHPLLFLSGESQRAGQAPDILAARLQYPPDQRYSKWAVIFDRPIQVEKVEVDTCSGTKPFVDGVELFVDQSSKRFYSDGGRRTAKFNVRMKASMLSLNFLESPGLCLEAIRLQTKSDWMRPRVLPARGDRDIADGALGFWDRRDSSGLKSSTADTKKSRSWRLQWENPLIVDGVRVWNGNQQPGPVFTENRRVHEIDVVLDDQKPLRFSLEDRRNFQALMINDPKSIRSLELTAVSGFPESGNTEFRGGEPAIGEVQLLAGGEVWLPVIPQQVPVGGDVLESPSSREIRLRGFGEVIDRELRSEEPAKDPKSFWKFRFRADGTFFAQVYIDRSRVARAWSAHGTWRLAATEKSVEKNGSGIVVELLGQQFASPVEEDSFAFDRGDKRPGPVVREKIEIQRNGKVGFILRNRTLPDERTIEFSDMKVRLHSLFD